MWTAPRSGSGSAVRCEEGIPSMLKHVVGPLQSSVLSGTAALEVAHALEGRIHTRVLHEKA